MKVLTTISLCALLGGCAANSGTGMTTRLDPGRSLEMSASGGEPVAQILNRGPGQVSIEQLNLPDAIIRLDTGGFSEFRMYRPVTVINRSTAPAGVEVRITGAKDASIRGPVNR